MNVVSDQHPLRATIAAKAARIQELEGALTLLWEEANDPGRAVTLHLSNPCVQVVGAALASGNVPNHATNAEGDCPQWCRACARNVGLGRNPDGTADGKGEYK